MTSKDENGNELKADIQNVINEMELDVVKQIGKMSTDIAEIKKDTNYISKELMRIEADYVKNSEFKIVTDKQIDHEKRLRVLEKGFWIGSAIITLLYIFKDIIIKGFGL